MNLLTIEGLAKQLGERPLFEDAHLLINTGDRIGLIGVNGSGKSTLLRIVAGLEAPDAGSVRLASGTRVEYLPQEPALDDDLTVLATVFASGSPQMQLLRAYEEASVALQQAPDDPARQAALAAAVAEMDRTGGWAAEANAKAILTKLGITDYQGRVGALSGGQRKRVALARALIDRADLLILDEPTNHIDAETVAWLEEYLATTPGALLMVTHDRYFLDRVVNRIVELDRRQLVSYPGNYSHYLEARAARHQALAEAEQKRRKLLVRELEWLRRSPMARGTKQKARKQRVEELMQIRYDSGDDVVAIALAGRRLGRQVLTAKGLVKAYNGAPVVSGVDLALEPGERIGIIGPNGAGKSTLLDLLAGKQTPDQGSVRWGETVALGYYDQRSEHLDDHQRIIEFVQEEAPLILTKDGQRVEAAQMLEWFLFPRPMQYARIGSLSGGERRRLYLLRTLIHQPNVLMLDEPTNDLDIQTLTVLEEFLDHFAGSLIVVSHDRYFLDRTVDFLLLMEDGKLGPRYPTPYTTFERLHREATGSETANAAAPETPKAERRADGPRKLTWKEQREYDDLEARIARLEKTKQALVEAINGCGDDYLRLQSLSEQLEATDDELDAALSRWFELAEIAEQS
ncbi:MAG TPA: ABC-F family ATP-binding cassette domain-containing protein [Caldilineaceae bacterium]|nr:ABC-F family ATP-binding cassette domain-containing protein [Caldilineaceae bacterium]